MSPQHAKPKAMVRIYVLSLLLFGFLHNAQSQEDSVFLFKASLADTSLIIKKSSGLYTNDYRTSWDMHAKCLKLLNEKVKVDGRIVSIERNHSDLTFRYIIKGSNNELESEFGILSNSIEYTETRGWFGVTWEVKYDFLIQIRQHVLSQSFELVIMPRIFERREGISPWNFRSDYQDGNSLPKTVDKSYKKISTRLYKYLVNI